MEMRDLRGNIIEQITEFEDQFKNEKATETDLFRGMKQILRAVGERDTQGQFFFQNAYLIELNKQLILEQRETNYLLRELVANKTQGERDAIVSALFEKTTKMDDNPLPKQESPDLVKIEPKTLLSIKKAEQNA